MTNLDSDANQSIGCTTGIVKTCSIGGDNVQLDTSESSTESLLGVESLWRIQIRSIRDQIVSGAKDYLEVANLAEHIGADYHGRFLIELLQNAEDPSRQTSNTSSVQRSTRLIIVRTDSAVAVLNQGAPFSEKDINAVTSLGLSNKNPETSLGNKGVGFKSVFQVTDRPEIYSSLKDDDLWSKIGNRFCMQEKPFADADFMSSISKIVEEEIAQHDAVRTEQLQKRAGSESARDYLIDKLQLAAPFKFPKPLSLKDQERRVEELGLSREIVGKMSTMVVLPLLDLPETAEIVDTALDELVRPDYPGSTLLFLTGISRIWIFDRVRGHEVLLMRRERSSMPLGGTIDFHNVTTAERFKSLNSCEKRMARWWRVNRRFGHGGSDMTTSTEEEMRIKEAVESLRIGTWKDVRSAYVGVALPRSPILGETLKPLKADGIFCIGLPTKICTGMPAWVNGPFHGHISRTSVDFKDQQYNRLILDEGIRIFWSALEYIKTLPSSDDRRHVLLEMELGNGSLQSGVEDYRELPLQEIVLDAEQTTFWSPSELNIPAEDDIEAFGRFFSNIEQIERYGFCLPDSVLLKNCWELLSRLAGKTDIAVDDSIYLQRLERRDSLLETTAFMHRGDGREWWEKFLDWVVERFDFSKLQDQRILPVGSNGLAAATDRVFFKPLKDVASGEQFPPKDESAHALYSEESIDDLDNTFLNDLAFLNERCVQVRKQAGQRILTDLARKLSPEQGLVLVRNPRRPEIINEVLAPYLSKICVIDEERDMALAVLAQIADWLYHMKQGPREIVNFSKIRVPVDEGDQWNWVAPVDVYFGCGWLGREIDELIERAYGEGDSHRLPSFSSFQCLESSIDLSRDIWYIRFTAVGVLAAPRLIRTSTGRRSYLKADSRNSLTVENLHRCPIPKAFNYWQQYLDKLATRSTEVRSGQAYYVRDPVWIDGLERDSAHESVMKLILRNSETYTESLQISVERENGVDSRQMLSLWVYAVVSQQWRVIPTNLGLCHPSKAWRLSGELKRSHFAREKILAYVEPPYDQAVRILEAVGVYSPEDAPVSRIVAELQDVAEALDSLFERSRRATEAFIRELYTWLQAASARTEDPKQEMVTVKKRPIPLLKNGKFTAVDLSTDAIILLNDDSERLPYIRNSIAAFVLPLHARQSNKTLYMALQNVLGEDRVMRASEAEIDLNFDQIKPDTRLLEYLVKGYQSKRPDIRRDLAALITYGGRPIMDPNKDAFREKWALFDNTRLRRGHFRNSTQTAAIFDQGASGGAALYVPVEYGLKQIFEACWHLLGPSHQHAWENYVTRLEADECGRFFDNMHLTDRDWIELDSVIGASKITQINRLQPVLLALRRYRESDIGVEQFCNDFDNLSDMDLDKIASWVGIERKVLDKVIANTSLVFDDERQLPIVEMLGVPIPDWQRARKDLGRDPVVFLSTVQLFDEWRANIVAYLRAVYARSETDANLLNELSEILEKLNEVSYTKSIAEMKINSEDIARHVISELRGVIDLDTELGEMMDQRLRSMGYIKTADKLYGRTPRREITLYMNQSEFQRESDAKEAVSNVLRVADALSSHCGDVINETHVLSSSTITPWLHGYWANCFAALRALRETLRASAPDTLKKLNKVGVFAPQHLVSWQTLWKKFPELGEPPSTSQVSPQNEVEVFGHQFVVDKFDAILSHGSDGQIGRAIADAVDEEFDITSLVTRERDVINMPRDFPAGSSRNSGGKGGRGGVRKADPQAGLLGEAFVYESFIRYLPDFDMRCWVSDSRRKYGFDQKGDDGLGYDFEYTDCDGKLTGMINSPHCLIEVKSTTSEENGPFPMTANEWAVAEKCYKRERKELYVIVRVLSVKSVPVIADVVVDPVRQLHEGKLVIDDRDYIVRTQR